MIWGDKGEEPEFLASGSPSDGVVSPIRRHSSVHQAMAAVVSPCFDLRVQTRPRHGLDSRRDGDGLLRRRHPHRTAPPATCGRKTADSSGLPVGARVAGTRLGVRDARGCARLPQDRGPWPRPAGRPPQLHRRTSIKNTLASNVDQRTLSGRSRFGLACALRGLPARHECGTRSLASGSTTGTISLRRAAAAPSTP